MTHTEKLEKLGFKKCVTKIKELKAIRAKMAIAYEHYRYCKPEKIDAFNQALKKESIQENPSSYQYKALKFISLGEYDQVPPFDVLESLEQAQERGCFDSFEIAKIEDVVEVKDPIVFGRINKCPDRFFIAQWDDDVNINQILKEGEG